MQLWIVPGSEVAWFLLVGGSEFVLEAVRPARFLEALRATADACRFGAADVAAPDPAELLPWTGNV